MTPREVWKDVVPGRYQVSSRGRVRSLPRKGRKSLRILTPAMGTYGYLLVSLRIDGRGKTQPVHRLVAKAFLPNPDQLREVNHKDGDKTNNHVSNLEWVTSAENHHHAVGMGLKRWNTPGEDHPKAILSAADVREVRQRLERGETCASIARWFGVSYWTISKIKHGKNWKRGKAS